MWHVTDKCPLKCPYCFAPKTEIGTPSEKIKSRVAALHKLGVLKIDISGGEPLVYRSLPDLCEAVASTSIALTITTSGVGLQDNIDFVLKKFKYFSRIIISIDAPTEKAHDDLRGKGTFNSALRLIQSIKSLEIRILRINTVVTRSFIENRQYIQMMEVVPSGSEWCLIQPHPANEKPGFRSHDISDEQFEACLKEASVEVVRKILIRRRQNYSLYWSMQPNGEVRQHTQEAHDGIKFNIDNDNLSDVMKRLQEIPTWIPSK